MGERLEIMLRGLQGFVSIRGAANVLKKPPLELIGGPELTAGRAVLESDVVRLRETKIIIRRIQPLPPPASSVA